MMHSHAEDLSAVLGRHSPNELDPIRKFIADIEKYSGQLMMVVWLVHTPQDDSHKHIIVKHMRIGLIGTVSDMPDRPNQGLRFPCTAYFEMRGQDISIHGHTPVIGGNIVPPFACGVHRLIREEGDPRTSLEKIIFNPEGHISPVAIAMGNEDVMELAQRHNMAWQDGPDVIREWLTPQVFCH